MPGSEFSAVSGWPTKETADKLGQISGRIVKRFFTRFHNLQRQALTQFIKLYQYMT